MKTKIQITVGQLVKVKGLSGKFRFVGRNIVKDIKTGRVTSVSFDRIIIVRKFNPFIFIAKAFVFSVTAFCFISLAYELFLNLTI